MIDPNDFITIRSSKFCQYFKPVSKNECDNLHNKLDDKSPVNSCYKTSYVIENDIKNTIYPQLKKECSLDTSVDDECNIESILNTVNPTCEVVVNKCTHVHCDFIIKHVENPTILVENKINNLNVSKTVVDNFKETCKLQNSNGILISQYAGIIGKENFEIDIVGMFVVVYLCQNYYNSEKIKIAIEIINKLSRNICMINTEKNDFTMTHNTLNEIKEEYQQFTIIKDHLCEFISAAHSQVMYKLNKLTLLKTGNFLATKFTQVDKPKSYLCNLCNIYTSNTLKGMAAHKRGCKKHHINKDNEH